MSDNHSETDVLGAKVLQLESELRLKKSARRAGGPNETACGR
jgi:hypothetical protein